MDETRTETCNMRTETDDTRYGADGTPKRGLGGVVVAGAVGGLDGFEGLGGLYRVGVRVDG